MFDTKEISINDLPLDKEDLQSVEKLQQKEDKIKAHIVIKSEQEPKKSLQGKQNFFITDATNFMWLAELNLSSNELKFIAYILKIMSHGNLVYFSQVQMAEDLKMAKSNVSYYIKKLKAKGILIENNRHTYINSKIFVKGLGHKMDKETRDHFKAAESDLTKEDGEKIVLKPFV